MELAACWQLDLKLHSTVTKHKAACAFLNAKLCCCCGVCLPAGVLTAAALCQAVAALQPAGTILVDESLTSGTAYWDASKVTGDGLMRLNG